FLIQRTQNKEWVSIQSSDFGGLKITRWNRMPMKYQIYSSVLWPFFFQLCLDRFQIGRRMYLSIPLLTNKTEQNKTNGITYLLHFLFFYFKGNEIVVPSNGNCISNFLPAKVTATRFPSCVGSLA